MIPQQILCISTLTEQDLTSFAAPEKCVQQLDMERAVFLVEQAFEEDVADNKKEALELYMQAAELCIKMVILTSSTFNALTALSKIYQI